MENKAGRDPDACLIDVCADWRQKSAAVEEAYGRWSCAPEADRALAFAAYKAALDREECASVVYGNHLRRFGSPRFESLLGHRRAPAPPRAAR